MRIPAGPVKPQRIAEAYVDDTDLWSGRENAFIQEIAAEMEETAQFWEQLLYTTGGALALENVSGSIGMDPRQRHLHIENRLLRWLQ